MKTVRVFLILLLGAFGAFSQTLKSPDGRLALDLSSIKTVRPIYSLSFKNKPVVRDSRLGIELEGQPDLTDKFTIVSTDVNEVDERWKPVWGEVSEIRDNYRQLTVTLEQKLAEAQGRTIVLRFRAFNDGISFRYEFPSQNGLRYFTVKEEKTEINLTGDHKAFWIPGDYDTNEYSYSTTRLSEIEALAVSKRQTEINTRAPVADDVVQTPLMIKTAEGIYINVHEAALVDYPAMYLAVDKQSFGMTTRPCPECRWE
jgi:hypothetical protein